MVIEFYAQEPKSYTHDDITVESDTDNVSIYGYAGAMHANFPFCKASVEVAKHLFESLEAHYDNLLKMNEPAIRYGDKENVLAAYNRQDVIFLYDFLKGLTDYLTSEDEKGLLPDEVQVSEVEEVEYPFLKP